MRIGILITLIRAEEKLLVAAFQKHGIQPDLILDRDLNFNVTAGPDQLAPNGQAWSDYDVVVDRCVSTSRGLYTLAILNGWNIRTINSYQTSSICADKLLTSIALAAHDVSQPHTRVAFAPNATMQALEDIKYPAVLKPVTGSWGRLLARVNDANAAESIIEHRETLGDYNFHIYYMQEYVNKPGRDIRAFVVGDRTICAIYRTSDHWITNTARGGKTSNCPVTPELNEICLRAARAVGGGVLAIDLLEEPDRGLLVNEINHTMEFRNSSMPTGIDIADEVARHVISQAKVRS